MLNLIEKRRILTTIQNNSIDKLLQREIASNDWSINKCAEVFDFLILDLYEKLNTQRKKPTKTIFKTIYCLYVTYTSILENKNKLLISQESLDKIFKLKGLYLNNIKEIDEIDVNTIDTLCESIKNENRIEIIQNDINIDKIEEKDKTENIDNAEIEKLKENLKDSKNKIKELNKEIKELNKKLENCIKQEEIEKYENEIANLRKQIFELNEIISKLNSKNTSIEHINEDLKKQINNTNKSFNDKIKVLEENLKISNEKAILYDKEKIQKEYEEELDNLILTYIADNDFTILELFEVLKTTFPSITKDSILASLKRLQEKYILTKETIKNNEFVYKLGKKRNIKYNFETNFNTLDLIIVSDMHIDNNIDFGIKNLNYIYDYAARNGIKTIINLGDIIDSRIYNDKSNLENLRLYDNLLDNIIERLPKDNSIINLLLGGNHDRSLLDFGINVTDRIDKNRLDYLSLGDDHAILQFNNSNIGLHHFNRRYDDDFINIDNNNDKNLLLALNDYYKYRGMNLNDSFIDLFGHFHVGKISIPNGYSTVPSLNRDHIQNGAYRMKLFFDSKGNIVNSIIIPLILEDKVIESVSINYQKRK